ncbi:hypothetical protein GCM10010967_18750 [Dyadobacter beijingensis]|uniref:Nucleotidyltransferase n=1 Tax=Dyadobacter beijingensis TaxID=365489 RepID=A0ABQ2HPW5_9BACT|nr:nucleotidyltransferase domain-containing protein [Dyadobacter beijingensis]GGM86660.1 hypothetical protein GCM10010967_18750 [Dyadobacter beijingensis]
MTTEIQQELSRLETQHNIQILYAVESGSRAWGFASVNSDWDVRYIYVHRPEWYLQIDDKKDNHEEILPNDIDLAGWELRKALRLFRKSNPSMLEWLDSPIVYQENFTATEKLRELKKQYFSPRSCLHHYLSMAVQNYENYLLKDMVPMKKYFYALRPVLACDWIRVTDTMAPTEFVKLLDSQVTDASLRSEIDSLLIRKSAGEELSEEPRIPLLHDFLTERIAFLKEYAKGLPPLVAADTAPLNALFRETLTEVWGVKI